MMRVMQSSRSCFRSVAMTLASLAVVYLLLYGRPSALEGGLLLPYTTHVSGERTVALTFDDGPDPVYTPQVLEVLARYDVKATFFIIGQHVDAHPELPRNQIVKIFREIVCGQMSITRKPEEKERVPSAYCSGEFRKIRCYVRLERSGKPPKLIDVRLS